MKEVYWQCLECKKKVYFEDQRTECHGKLMSPMRYGRPIIEGIQSMHDAMGIESRSPEEVQEQVEALKGINNA